MHKANCKKCQGTGRHSRSAGVCFRCRGKGYQTREDHRRNGCYDRRRAHAAQTW